MMVQIKESYTSNANKPARPNDDVHGSMSNNTAMTYINNSINNLHNFYMTN
jgi:hypothetical protein